ncbi:MAG: DUF1559 domain-containing protein [Planctomycetota bacterium]
MLKRIRPLLLLLMCGLMMSGCGQNNPAPVAKPPDPLVPTVKLTPTPESGTPPAPGKTTPADSDDPPIAKAKPLSEAKPKAAVSVNAQTFPEAAYLGDDVVGLAVAHPKRVTEWPAYQMVKEAGLLNNFERQMQGFHIQPESIERVALIIDQTPINTFAKALGLAVGGEEPPAAAIDQNLLRNNLKQTALAFHNYEATYSKFPRANGNGEGNQTGLSWRVHLLPFLGQADLYQQFRLDEPWDSDHNKTLIEKMPAIFQSPGVTEEGKTSMHVFTGKDTPFDGEKGKSFRDFTDGTANTILAVLAGADTADVWTKPGGLKFDPAACKKALGEITDKTFLAIIAEGSVRSIPLDIEDAKLANLIQLNDGNVVNLDPPDPSGSSHQIPTAILTLATEANRPEIVKSVLREATEETHEGQTLFKNETSAVWFADDKTVVCGPIDTVKKMVATKQSGMPGTPKILSQLQLGADFTLAFDVASQTPLLEQAAQLNPTLGLALQVKSLTLQMTVTGVTDDKLFELVVTTNDEQSAALLSQLATGLLAQAKVGLGQFRIPDETDEEKAAKKLIEQLVKSADIKQNGDRIEFLVPVPEGFDKLPELLKPTLMKARAATDAKNNLKQIGLAFHNYHDSNLRFPGAGRSADGKAGLSWRVHLLPYLDQAPLYNQFKLDEAWDSDHNKTLIEKMPALFNVDGVTEVGKTSLHVFTGDGAPFAKDQAPGIRDFTDGTSNTILVVQAGPDKADIWTKPGGLDFDPKNPIKALGTLTEDLFNVLITDGSVSRLNKTIEAETFRRLIKHQDAELINGF